jgi:hypothetical protein
MFNLDHAITEWRRQMLAGGIQAPIPLEELENHLRDDVEQQLQAGLSAEQAFNASVLRVGQAFIAAQQAEWLAHLRLNETNDVMNDMDKIINTEVSAIALWDGVAKPDDKTRKERDKFLVAVKVYRESYPSTGPGASRINALLDTISGRNPKSTCESGICRLDDMRLAKLNSITNSP